MSLVNDIPKAYFDRYIPRFRDGFSSANMRNNFLALASADFLPCRAIGSVVVETHDVGSDVAAAALYSGTGVTVTRNISDVAEGSACIEATVDGTGNRQIIRATLAPNPIDLSNFDELGVWVNCVTSASSTIKYLVRDGSGNESYWNITTNGSADTWQQFFLGVSSPDSNNGTDADMTNVVQYGYKSLAASKVYLFDAVTGYIWAMKVWINGSNIANYFYPVYIAGVRINYAGGFSPTITAPSATNSRMDLLSLTPSATIALTNGTEMASPGYADIPSTPAGNIPLYAIYVPYTATKIVEYQNHGSFATDAYIYADLRPWCGN